MMSVFRGRHDVQGPSARASPQCSASRAQACWYRWTNPFCTLRYAGQRSRRGERRAVAWWRLQKLQSLEQWVANCLIAVAPCVRDLRGTDMRRAGFNADIVMEALISGRHCEHGRALPMLSRVGRHGRDSLKREKRENKTQVHV